MKKKNKLNYIKIKKILEKQIKIEEKEDSEANVENKSEQKRDKNSYLNW